MADSPDKSTPVSPEKDSPKLEEAVEIAEDAVKTPDSMESNEGGWWGSWITAAKSKSVEVLGMVKKDLDELSMAVKSEASHVINTTSSAIGKTLKLDEPESTANTMKKSISSFLDQVNTVLNPSPDDEDTEIILEINGDYVTLPTYQKDLIALQKLDATYLIAPEGQALASMAAWLEATTRPSPSTLDKHLRSSSILQEKMGHLVPHAVTEEDFWERYLFRKALLEDKLAQISRISSNTCTDPIVNSICPTSIETQPHLSEESPTHSSISSGDSARSNYGSSKSRSMDFEPSTTRDIDKIGDYIDGVAWENEDFASNIELTEEQQIKLLQEYENEITASERNKSFFEDALADSPEFTPESSSPASPKSNKSSPQKKSQINTKLNKIPTKGSKTAPGKAGQNSKTGKSVQSKKSTETVSNLIEDHFVVDKKTTEKKTKVKTLSEELTEKDPKVLPDNASSNSDESWEKEFEIDDLHISAK